MINHSQEFRKIFPKLGVKIQPMFRQLEILWWKLVVTLLAWKPARLLPGILLVIGVSLLATPVGVIFVHSRQSENQFGFSPNVPLLQRSTPPQVSNSGQINVLLVMVDRLEVLNPTIDGVWLIVNGQFKNGSNFLPVDISSLQAAVNSSATGLTEGLINPDGSPTKKFSDGLISKGLWWDHYVVIDRQGLGGLIGWTGNTLANDPTMNQFSNGTGDTVQQDEKNVVEQANYLRVVCERSDLINRNLDPNAILSLLEGHFRTDYDLSRLHDDWYAFRERGFAWYCNFPTLKESSFIGQNQ